MATTHTTVNPHASRNRHATSAKSRSCAHDPRRSRPVTRTGRDGVAGDRFVARRWWESSLTRGTVQVARSHAYTSHRGQSSWIAPNNAASPRAVAGTARFHHTTNRAYTSKMRRAAIERSRCSTKIRVVQLTRFPPVSREVGFPRSRVPRGYPEPRPGVTLRCSI